MDVELSPENQQFVDAVVANGVYATPQAAIDQALRLLRRHEELRTAIAEGMEGETIPGDVVFERLERRVAELS
jgi:putative addiction module CopG family antidote